MLARVRVFLVDRPTLFRRSLGALLHRRRGLQVVGEADNGAQALAQARVLRPDVLVVEPAVPGGGPPLIAALDREVGGCAVLVLTDEGDQKAVGLALRAGARGYLHKDCEPDDLVRAIHCVQAGELVVTRNVISAVLRAPGEASAGEPGGLTQREFEVLQLVTRGCRNAEIARGLVVSEHTVKAHLANILYKLGLRNRVELAAFALQHGLIRSSGAP